MQGVCRASPLREYTPSDLQTLKGLRDKARFRLAQMTDQGVFDMDSGSGGSRQ